MRVLSLGAGEQSTAIYFLAALGEIEPIDYAIFADTGEEPNWVYETVKALSEWRHPDTGKPGPPVIERWRTDSQGRQVRLGDQMIDGSGWRCASAPVFIKHLNQFDRRGKNAQGKVSRQCTREFKADVVEGAIRREILGLAKGERYRGERISHVFGFDRGEGERIYRTKGRLAQGPLSEGDFPLFDLEWRRPDCRSFLAEVPGWGREVLPSACVFCPLVNNAFRRLVRDRDPAGHARACLVDEGIRKPDAILNRTMDGELYIHRQMRPYSEVDLDADGDGLLPMMVGHDCEGYCGH